MAKEAALREEGTELAIKELNGMIENIKQLHGQLRKLEKDYSEQLKTNPSLAGRLMSIREELGLPMALGAFQTKTGPGIIDKLTGGGFYEQLAVQILEIGREATPATGGSIGFADLVYRVQKAYSGYVVSISDIEKAVEVLLKKSLIVRVEKLDTGIKVIVFTEADSPDVEMVLRLAIKNNGLLSREKIILATSWSLKRTENALKILVERQIAEKAESVEGVSYLFPGV